MFCRRCGVVRVGPLVCGAPGLFPWWSLVVGFCLVASVGL